MTGIKSESLTTFIGIRNNNLLIKELMGYMDERTRRMYSLRHMGYSWNEIAPVFKNTANIAQVLFNQGVKKVRSQIMKLKDKKNALASQPFSYLTRSLKDPEWQPPEEPEEKKSKTGINTGGGGGDEPKVAPKMPLELRRKMEQRVLKSVLPEGDRALPVAGLIFFQYRGKTQNMKDMELVYRGAAGTVSLPLQP